MTAFEKGARFAEPHEGADTIASGIRVPSAVGDFMILDAVRESEGRAIAVEEEGLRRWMELAVSREGISLCPEAAACVGAMERLAEEGWIAPKERVVIYNTGALQKYADFARCDLPLIDKDEPMDWDRIEHGAAR